MSKSIAALAAGALALAAVSAYAQDPAQSGATPSAQEPGRTNDPGSAQQQPHQSGAVQSGGAAAGSTPGRENEPCAPQHGTSPAGGDVKCRPEGTATEPGRENDPASAERRR